MVDMVNELDGKVAIVTGSARNIGRATAEELARAGAAVVINSVQAKDLCEEVVEGIRAAGGKAIPFMADVRDPDAVTAMAAAASRYFGGIDILVHNAAVRNNTSFEDMDLETFSTTVDISIYGMFHLAKAVLPSMKERGGGAIIGVGGMTSTRGAATRSHTMAAKMGLNALIRGLALGQIAGNNKQWLYNKELWVGMSNGLVWALVVGGISYLWFNDPLITLVITLAIFINMSLANLSGNLRLHSIHYDCF